MRIRRRYLYYLTVVQFLIILIGLIYYQPHIFSAEKQEVLVIDMTGELTSTTFPGLYDSAISTNVTPVSSTEIANILQYFEQDNNIKAFILEIDSNGGNQFAQEELVSQIWRMKKPVVAVIRDKALSSGYFVSAATDRIYANELSNIGDIGVLGTYDFTNKKTGESGICYIPSVKYKNIYFDDCSDVGMGQTDYEREIYALKGDHDAMVYQIAYFRNLSYAHVSKLADGSIYTGREALQNRLIDEIGDTKNATEWLEAELEMDLEVIYFRELNSKIVFDK